MRDHCKVIARADKPGNDGAQLLIYDLVGGATTAASGRKANAMAAIGMDQNARQPGLLVVRIP